MSDLKNMSDHDLLEYVYYLRRCAVAHTETYQACQAIQGYTQAQKDSACAEAAYWHDRGELPTWGTIIERVESNDTGNIFVHWDVRKEV